jgi:hypothetical protein
MPRTVLAVCKCSVLRVQVFREKKMFENVTDSLHRKKAFRIEVPHHVRISHYHIAGLDPRSQQRTKHTKMYTLRDEVSMFA